MRQQLGTFFPWYRPPACFDDLVGDALARTDRCIAGVAPTGYGSRTGEGLDLNHTDMYATFLYFLSNCAVHHSELETASRAYALNKALHALDVMFEVELPEVFLLVHPVGTVLGRANYRGRLVVYQSCTVGSNLDFERPTLEDGVALMPRSAVIGRSRIGANSFIGAGATVMNLEVPAGSMVIQAADGTAIRASRRSVVDRYFREPAGHGPEGSAAVPAAGGSG